MSSLSCMIYTALPSPSSLKSSSFCGLAAWLVRTVRPSQPYLTPLPWTRLASLILRSLLLPFQRARSR
eukprot:4301812-Pleurochrysis_carterae.AAC.1